MSQDAALAAYFSEAASWDADRVAQGRRQIHIAWWTAAAGWSAAVSACLALLALTPLKRVDPFVVRVDNTTGVVDVVPVYAGHSELSEAVTRYLLSHYVTVCERFNFVTAESDYEECGAFHTAGRNQAWFEEWNVNNPHSPLNAFKDGTTVRAQVVSVTFFTKSSGVTDLAQVRYVKARHPAGGADEQVTHWIATLQYAYAEPSTDPKMRRWNPIGFKVVDFKTEPEVLGEGTGNLTAGSITTPSSHPGAHP